MVMFPIKEINLGEIKVSSTNTLEFPYSDLDYISRITSPCVCTDVNNYAKEKLIRATYKPKDIPVHLKAEGISKQPVKYTIVAEYMKAGQTGVVELVFTATIIG